VPPVLFRIHRSTRRATRGWYARSVLQIPGVSVARRVFDLVEARQILVSMLATEWNSAGATFRLAGGRSELSRESLYVDRAGVNRHSQDRAVHLALHQEA